MVIGLKIKNMDLVYLNILIKINMKEIGSKIKNMVKEYSFFINNKLHIEVIGKIIWQMEKVHYHMKVVINIKDFLKIIKKMDLVLIKNQ